MASMEALRAKIPQFPGYGEENARRIADELIRSYLGEALALLDERHPEYFANHDHYEALLLRTSFMNQAAFKAFEYAAIDGDLEQKLVDEDMAVVEVADKASTIDASGLDAYLDQIAAALDRRDKTMVAAGASPRP
jgi:hypothetical protein